MSVAVLCHVQDGSLAPTRILKKKRREENRCAGCSIVIALYWLLVLRSAMDHAGDLHGTSECVTEAPTNPRKRKCGEDKWKKTVKNMPAIHLTTKYLMLLVNTTPPDTA